MDEILTILRRELTGAWRFRVWGIIAAWLFCILGWFVVLTIDDVYQAQAKVFVETQSRLDRVIDDVVVPEETATQVNLVREVMLTRPTFEHVAQETDLALRAKTPEEFAGLIDYLQSEIKVAGRAGNPRMPTPEDGIYTIFFRDKERSMSLAVVDSLLNAFMEDVIRGKQSSSEEAIQFLREEIVKYEQQLAERDQALADFKQRNVGLLPAESGGYFDRLQVAINGMKETENRLRNAESRRAALQSQLTGETPFVAEDGDDPLLSTTEPRTDLDRRIMELEGALSELLLRFTEKHPDVLATQEQLDRLHARRKETLEGLMGNGGEGVAALATNPVYQELKIDLNAVDVEIAGLRSELAQDRAEVTDLQNRVNEIPQIEAQLAALTRDYDQVSATYDEIRRLLEQEIIALRKKGSSVVNFRIIEPPFVTDNPIFPPRGLLIMVVLVLGVMAGGAVSWAIHWSNPVFADVQQIRELLDRPVLGTVSMTWKERHRLERRKELARVMMAFAGLFIVFIVVYISRGEAVTIFQQLTS